MNEHTSSPTPTTQILGNQDGLIEVAMSKKTLEITSANLGEAQALREAVSLALSRVFMNVVFEGGAMNNINNMEENGDGDTKCGIILDDRW